MQLYRDDKSDRDGLTVISDAKSPNFMIMVGQEEETVTCIQYDPLSFEKIGSSTGEGVYICATKTIYLGEFTNSCFNGYGEITYLGGASYRGEFKDGEMHGFGKYIYSDGSSYSGFFVEGLRSGRGVFSCTDYKIIGQWVRDQLHGAALIYVHKTQSVRKAIFNKGKYLNEYTD